MSKIVFFFSKEGYIYNLIFFFSFNCYPLFQLYVGFKMKCFFFNDDYIFKFDEQNMI